MFHKKARRSEKIDSLPSATKKLLIEQLRQAQIQPEYPYMLHDYFHMLAETLPDKIACVFHDEFWKISLTYQELDNCSSQLANYLKAKIPNPNVNLGICITRSLNTPIAFLAAFKAGFTVVPLETSESVTRDHKLKEANITYVLVDDETKVTFNNEIQKINIDAAPIEEYSLSYHNGAKPDSFAYILFTSGTTGTPKGVRITHNALTNLYQGLERLNPVKECNILCTADYKFDAFLWDWIYAWTAKGTVHFTHENDRFNPLKLCEIIEQYHIDVMVSLPEIFREMSLSTLCKLKEITSMGAAPHKPTLLALYNAGVKVYNGYGITETGIGLCLNRFEPQKPLNIIYERAGAIQNMVMILVNEHNTICQLGEQGEILIGGPQLGEYTDPDLNQQKFRIIVIDTETLAVSTFNPKKYYSSSDIILRVYHSGDKASYSLNADNELIINYSGRINNVIKIHGVSVNLDKVQNFIETHENVEKAIVVVNFNDDRLFLIAHVITKDGEQLTRDELQRHLKETTTLPFPTSFPTSVHTHKAFPRTTNGKVDTRSLNMIHKNVPPRSVYNRQLSTTQSILLDIWSDLLGLPANQIDIHRDQYVNLGGKSINFMRLTNRIIERFELDPKAVNQRIDLFSMNMTIATLNAKLQRHLIPAENRRKRCVSEFPPDGILKIDTLYYRKSDLSNSEVAKKSNVITELNALRFGA